MDLAQVVRHAVEELGPAAEQKRLEVLLGAEGTVEMCGDPDRLAQVVTNLVSNAIKFSPPGGRIEVRLGAGDQRALLRVSDTGPGIPVAERARVFDRLYRGDQGGRARVSGAGLGLAIAKSIVEAHGGEISLGETGPGGTTIEVSLPLGESASRLPTASI